VTTGGLAELSYEWDGNPVTIGNGTFISVEPGSELEAAIGADNLADPLPAQLTAAQSGAGPSWTSNA
jgi:hypothetical protein